MAVADNFTYGINSTSLTSSSLWRSKLAAVTLIVFWAYVFFPEINLIWQKYLKSSYDYHGFLVVPLFLLLYITSRSNVLRTIPCSSQLGLIGILLVSLVWLFAEITKLQLLEQIAVIAMLPLIFLTTHGLRLSKELSYSLFFLFFLLPVGKQIYDWLVQLSLLSLLTSGSWSNISLNWDQNYLYTDKNKLDIYSMLYSMHFGVVYLMLGACFAFYLLKQLFARVFTIICFLLFPWLFNLLGNYLIIKFENFKIIELSTVEQLKYNSIIFTSIGLVVAISISFILRYFTGNGADSLNEIVWQQQRYGKLRWLQPSLIVIFIFLSLPWLSSNIKNYPWKNKVHKSQKNLQQVSSWQGPISGKYFNWQPEFNNLQTASIQQYIKDDSKVAWYHSQIQADKVVYNLEKNKIYDTKKWHEIKSKIIKIKHNDHRVKLNEIVLTQGQKKRVIWYWFYVNNNFTSNKTLVKIKNNLQLFTNFGRGTEIMAVAMDFKHDLKQAEDSLIGFVKNIPGEYFQQR